jgi:hypothetical protein
MVGQLVVDMSKQVFIEQADKYHKVLVTVKLYFT